MTISTVSQLKKRWPPRAIVITVANVLLIVFAYGLMLLSRFDFQYTVIPAQFPLGYGVVSMPIIVTAVLAMGAFGGYESILTYASLYELRHLTEAWLFESLLVALYALTIAPPMPASFWFGGTALAYVLTVTMWLSERFLRAIRKNVRDVGLRRVMAAGAGEAGRALIHEIEIEDLLGRDPVMVDGSGIHDLVAGCTVLVTGGGGSIGSEICRQVARENPKRLVVFDICENSAYAIQQELWMTCPGLDLVVLIGSVRDAGRVRSVFAKYMPDVVFHAAAHKHVPLMEENPHEAIKNNVFGTLNCARAALEFDVMRFVLISTDKAVNPTNVMGATKRLCEMIIQAEGRRAVREGVSTTFSAVRFGNVLGSSGSVVPLFEKQIAEGGPVTVTHPDITRYFMTIPEAVGLVLQSACYAEGGEIFILDMGEPVRIADMARNLIRLAGYEPDVDIKITYTGLRPGEKLFEERLMAEEGLHETGNRMISVARPIVLDDAVLAAQLRELSAALEDESSDVRSLLRTIVPTYMYEG